MKRSPYTLLLLLFCYSCANIVSPSGGPKDTDAPAVKEAVPPNFTTRFSGKKVVISFSEFVNLNDPSAQVLVSPPLENPPQLIVRNKDIVVSWEEELAPNTTYTINFGDAIEDITERNKLKNFQYVFSTGDYIDSLSIQGQVLNAVDRSAPKDIWVMLYKEEGGDSVFYKKKPFYYTRADESGRFSLNNLKEGRYQLFALQDANYDLKYSDRKEKIAFWPEIVQLTDSLPPFRMSLFEDEDRSIYLLDNAEPATGHLQFYYSNPVQSFSMQSIGNEQNLPDRQVDFSAFRDTVDVWYTYNYEKDAEIVAIANDTIFDTLRLKAKVFDTASPVVDYAGPFKLQNNGKQGISSSFNPMEPIRLNFNRPVKNWIPEAVQVWMDTTRLPVEVKAGFEDSLKTRLVIEGNWKQDMLYELLIRDSTFFDTYGLTNDSIQRQYQTGSQEDFGVLICKLDSLKPDLQYIFQLLNKQGNVVKDSVIIGQQTIIFSYNYMPPGAYSMKLIADENGNGRWDTGNFAEKRQPEPVTTYGEELNLRANWDTEVVFFFRE